MKVIDHKNLPSRIPLWQTAVTYLLLDRFHASGWVWGVCATLWVILWISFFMERNNERSIDIFHTPRCPACVGEGKVHLPECDKYDGPPVWNIAGTSLGEKFKGRKVE
jgi:hypothetical protein